MAVLQLIGKYSTTGAKGITPCAAAAVVFLLQFCFLFAGAGDGRFGFIKLTGVLQMGGFRGVQTPER